MTELQDTLAVWLAEVAAWLRAFAPAELSQLPDWALVAVLAAVVLAAFVLVTRIVGAVLRPVVRVIEITALLVLAAAAGLYILRSLGYV